MVHIRSSVVRLAAGVLMAQLLFMAVAAVAPAFCCEPAGATDALADCCKGEGHTCTLKQHHDDDGDTLRSCPRGDERIAVLLFGAAGILVDVQPLTGGPAPTAIVADDLRFARAHFGAVESPPPKT